MLKSRSFRDCSYLGFITAAQFTDPEAQKGAALPWTVFGVAGAGPRVRAPRPLRRPLLGQLRVHSDGSSWGRAPRRLRRHETGTGSSSTPTARAPGLTRVAPWRERRRGPDARALGAARCRRPGGAGRRAPPAARRPARRRPAP